MSIKSILSAIAHFPAAAVEAISNLFNSASKAWHHLSPELQSAFTQGSGVIAVINNMINSPFGEVVTSITEKFGLSEEQLQAGLQKVATGLNLGENLNNADLQTLIENLQGYFGEQHDKDWAKAASITSQVLADFLAPNGTPYSIIVSFIEIAYREVVKPMLGLA